MIQELYERHYEELWRYCVRLCRNGERAFDLVQETFLKALERAETMAVYSPEQQRSWLYKAARNLFLDGVRKSALLQRKQSLLLNEEEGRRTASPGRRRNCCCSGCLRRTGPSSAFDTWRDTAPWSSLRCSTGPPPPSAPNFFAPDNC